ncbi:hypothetical protein FACUT_7312 [Fusarium acutatum]|uniref:Uncharacterized protein n=1 Tax=Fusarium acutatum TaxID=78861 RepID=A0A8H4JQK3_9HYPO|nr:hypothetical protein FACUT_7312 [Fusarium acutatum]
MAESTSAERLDYLLEMALTIHEGIVEHLGGDDELDNQLIAHLKEVDHFVVVKKALQGRFIKQSGENQNERAADNITPPRSHHSPSAAGDVNDNTSASSQRHQSPRSPSLFFSLTEPQRTKASAPTRRKATRRILGESRNSKAIREMRRAVPYASWVDSPR